MKNCMKDFHLCEEESPEFIFHSFVLVGKGIFLVIILFYSVHCFWLTSLVPDFLTNSHLAFSLSPTYISFRTSCKQAGEFHSLGAWEYMWSCSHFRVDFSPITYVSVIARCLVERATSTLGISRPGWGQVPEHLWFAIFLTSPHLKNGDWQSQISLFHMFILECWCVWTHMEDAFKNSKRRYYLL